MICYACFSYMYMLNGSKTVLKFVIIMLLLQRELLSKTLCNILVNVSNKLYHSGVFFNYFLASVFLFFCFFVFVLFLCYFNLHSDIYSFKDHGMYCIVCTVLSLSLALSLSHTHILSLSLSFSLSLSLFLSLSLKPKE